MEERGNVLLPAVSILILVAAFLFLTPDMTGMTVMGEGGGATLEAEIVVSLSPENPLTADCAVVVEIGRERSEMYIEKFMMLSGKEFSNKDGQLLGNGEYSVPLSEFGMKPSLSRGKHSLVTMVVRGEEILSEGREEIVV